MHDPLKPYQNLPELPPSLNFDDPEILKSLISAHSKLSAVKHATKLLNNPAILINAVPLLESQASSAIENIVTTQDELFKATALPQKFLTPSIKETLRYRTALKAGFNHSSEPLGKLAVEVVSAIENETIDYRAKPGTKIMNAFTKEIFYTPPSGYKTITRHIQELDHFMCNYHEIDPLVKVALAHYQFEAIHPFPDGNGRTGRILIQLYLIAEGLIDEPILYISRYINRYKNEYYELLRGATRQNAWKPWILYIIKAIEDTATWTLNLIDNIEKLNKETVKDFKLKLPKIYSYELVQFFFTHPYCRIEQLATELNITRQTASTWLQNIAEEGFLDVVSVGKLKIYINRALVQLFA